MYKTVFYHNDIINYIASFMNYIDNKTLITLESIMIKIINPQHYDFNMILFNRLSKKLGQDDSNNLLIMLKKYNNYIFGSFLLQCMYNVEWPDSDIDICCVSEIGKTRDDIRIVLHGWETIAHDNPFNFCLWICEHFSFKSVVNYNYDLIYPIHSIKFKLKNGIIINHITIFKKYAETPFAYLSKNADINICKNLYDGNKLFIKHMSDLQTKTTLFTFDYLKIINSSIKQLSEEHRERIAQLFERHMERIEKYTNRGFLIIK